MFSYNSNTPVLFIVFNRPDLTLQVFKQIKKAKPYKLYIAVDGPRTNEEESICREVRSICSSIDWDCEVKTLFQEKNLGCGEAVNTALDWFFKNEPEGIVLEDDCFPADDFFGFCSTMLEKYRDDDRIGHISGGNYQNGIKRGDGSYYFSTLTNVWGWAGWRRIWQEYDINIPTFRLFEKMKYIDKMPSHGPFKDNWMYFFNLHHEKGVNSWDFQYAYLNLINNRLSIIPNTNLISNLGCDNKATHYLHNHPFSSIPLGRMNEIKHPVFIVPDVEADLHAQSLELSISKTPEDSFSDFLFVKKRLTELNGKIEKIRKIPSIIHQIYEDPAGPPALLLKLSATWKEYHPKWEFKFWNKQTINDFMESHFPDLLPQYRSFPFDVQRWDVIRYLILYYYGGLYVDMDYECLEPIDALLGDSSCCLGLEPVEHAFRNKMPYIIGNAFMATTPKHPYLQKIIDDIRQKNTTNPFMKRKDCKLCILQAPS